MADSMLGAVLGFKGKKPEVPPFNQISVADEQSKAISGNIANFGDASKLAGQTNAFNQDQILSMLKAAIPGYDSIQQKSSDILQSGLKGEIPDDVATAVQNKSAQRALAGGFGGGSGMGRSLTARDLGRTSYDITQNALASSERWLANTKQLTVPQLFDPTNMFVTPQQRIATTMWNTSNAWNAQWLTNQIKAMPSPEKQAYGGAMDWIAGIGESATTMGMGGMMGGGGGGGGGMGGMMGMFGGGGGGGGGSGSSAPQYPSTYLGGGSGNGQWGGYSGGGMFS